MKKQTSKSVNIKYTNVKERKTLDRKTSLRMGLAWLILALVFTASTFGHFLDKDRLTGMPSIPSWVFSAFVTCILWLLSLFWLRLAYKLRRPSVENEVS